MEVILLKDVPKFGRRGDVKHVSDGYAQNMLLPRGLAERATPAKIAALQAQKEHSEEQLAAMAAELVAKVKDLEGKRFEMKVKADKTGHLYQKIDVEKVSVAIGVPRSLVMMDHPIKEVGEHVLTVKSEKVSARVIIAVIAQ